MLVAARAVASREPAVSARSRGRATRNLLPRAGGVGQARGVRASGQHLAARAVAARARAASGGRGVGQRAASDRPRCRRCWRGLPTPPAWRRAGAVLVAARAVASREPAASSGSRGRATRNLLPRASARRPAARAVALARAGGVEQAAVLVAVLGERAGGRGRAGRGVGRRAGRAGGVEAAVLVAVLVERVASGRPRCWSPRGLLLRVSRRRRRIEASGNAQPVAPRGRRRAGGGCWTPHGLVLRVSGRRRAAEVLLAARAVVPRRAGGVEQAAVSVIGPSSVRHRSVSSRERAASGRPRCWSPCWASGRRQAGRGVGRRCCPRASGQSGRPRCWSPRELLPRVSGRHRAGRGVGRRASCCLAHVRDTCFQPAASSFRPAARSFRLASSLLHRPIARGDSPRDRLHSRQRAARPVPLSI